MDTSRLEVLITCDSVKLKARRPLSLYHWTETYKKSFIYGNVVQLGEQYGSLLINSIYKKSLIYCNVVQLGVQ